MIDISTVTDGLDLGLLDTQTNRAANILSVQIGSLEYAPDLGIDLKYFLTPDFRIQNASFKQYLIQVLAGRGINVSSLDDSGEPLLRRFIFNLTGGNETNGLVAR